MKTKAYIYICAACCSTDGADGDTNTGWLLDWSDMLSSSWTRQLWKTLNFFPSDWFRWLRVAWSKICCRKDSNSGTSLYWCYFCSGAFWFASFSLLSFLFCCSSHRNLMGSLCQARNGPRHIRSYSQAMAISVCHPRSTVYCIRILGNTSTTHRETQRCAWAGCDVMGACMLIVVRCCCYQTDLVSLSRCCSSWFCLAASMLMLLEKMGRLFSI